MLICALGFETALDRRGLPCWDDSSIMLKDRGGESDGEAVRRAKADDG
jgi:hypothetical protein